MRASMESKPSITEVVSRYVTLRQQGREQVGLCPFHAEKTPSFWVNEDKGLFYCHGCHEKGDVIDFIELIEKVNYQPEKMLI